MATDGEGPPNVPNGEIFELARAAKPEEAKACESFRPVVGDGDLAESWSSVEVPASGLKEVCYERLVVRHSQRTV